MADVGGGLGSACFGSGVGDGGDAACFDGGRGLGGGGVYADALEVGIVVGVTWGNKPDGAVGAVGSVRVFGLEHVGGGGGAVRGGEPRGFVDGALGMWGERVVAVAGVVGVGVRKNGGSGRGSGEVSQ